MNSYFKRRVQGRQLLTYQCCKILKKSSQAFEDLRTTYKLGKIEGSGSGWKLRERF